MKSPLFLLCCLASLSVFAQTTGMEGWHSFTDTAGKFLAKYPPDWKNKIKEGNRVFFTSPADSAGDRFFENINIAVSQNPAYGTSVKIKDLFPSVMEKIEPAFREFKNEGQRFFKWNNTDAAEIIYSGYNKTDESLRVRMTQWFCFYKTRLYTVTYTAAAANSSHTATAAKIMGSIFFK